MYKGTLINPERAGDFPAQFSWTLEEEAKEEEVFGAHVEEKAGTEPVHSSTQVF